MLSNTQDAKNIVFLNFQKRKSNLNSKTPFANVGKRTLSVRLALSLLLSLVPGNGIVSYILSMVPLTKVI